MSGIAVARLVRATPGSRESRESPDSPGLHGSRSSQRGWTKHPWGVLAFTLIYAVCFVAIKAGLAYAPPLYYGGLRALIGGAALLPVLVVLREPLLPGRRHWPWVPALALISTSVAFGAMFLSPTRTEAGIASVLGNPQLLFAVVLAALFLGERVTTGKLVALRSGIAGVTLISYASFSGPGGPGEPDVYEVAGAVLALVASGAAAGGSVTLKRMGAGCPLLTVAAWQLIVGSLPLLAASSVLEAGATVVWNAEFVGLLLFLALVGTSFATALWYRLLQSSEVGELTLFLFLVPVVGLAVAAAAFGEPLSWLEVGGALLTVAGIGATTRERSRGRTG